MPGVRAPTAVSGGAFGFSEIASHTQLTSRTISLKNTADLNPQGIVLGHKKLQNLVPTKNGWSQQNTVSRRAHPYAEPVVLKRPSYSAYIPLLHCLSSAYLVILRSHLRSPASVNQCLTVRSNFTVNSSCSSDKELAAPLCGIVQDMRLPTFHFILYIKRAPKLRCSCLLFSGHYRRAPRPVHWLRTQVSIVPLGSWQEGAFRASCL